MPYEPLRQRAWWAIGAFAATILLDAVAVVSDWHRYDLLGRIIGGATVTLAEAQASDDRQEVIGVLQLVLLVLTVIVFLRWFRQAYRNLDALGGVRSHGTGWAVGAWFVPILNLWRPLEIARDIWRGSDPDRPEASRGTERIPGLLACWWGFFVVSNLASNAASRLAFRGDTPEDVRDTALAFLVGDALDLVAAGLAVAVVHHATSRQEERRARRRFEGEPVTPA